MMVREDDRPIVKWAMEKNYNWYYAREIGLPDPCLKVHCGPVAVYFHQGAILRVWFEADHELFDDAFNALMELFSLCASGTVRRIDECRAEADADVATAHAIHPRLREFYD